MIATFNTAMTETASEILGKHRQKKRRKKKKKEKNLGHFRNSWSMRQNEWTGKEKIRTRRILKIQGSGQQHQEKIPSDSNE